MIYIKLNKGTKRKAAVSNRQNFREKKKIIALIEFYRDPQC